MSLADLFKSREQRRDYQEFVDRFKEGPPWEGYTDREVIERYQQVAPTLTPEEHATALQGAIAQLSSDQQQELTSYLQQQSGLTTIELGASGEASDQVLGRLSEAEPAPAGAASGPFGDAAASGPGGGGGADPAGGGLGDLLGQVLGGAGARPGEAGGGPFGGASVPQSNIAGDDTLLENPLVKAILAGVVAMAAQKMMEGQSQRRPRRSGGRG